jgi:BD-FAE
MKMDAERILRKSLLGAAAVTAFLVSGMAQAQVPPDIAAKLKEMGKVVDPAGTAKLYRPLQPNPPYAGVSVTRDVSFGPDPKDILDVFSPEKGKGARPVLIYVSGGAGNKIEPVPNGDAFYDNIMLWAVKHGMTGVNVQRHGGFGGPWDQPAKDIGMVVQWVHTNIAKYKGNPNRVFIWAHSAGNGPVGTYIGHPEFYGPEGVGLVGVVFMSSPGFDIAPAKVTPPPGGAGIQIVGGRGRGPGRPGAANGKGRGRGRGFGQPLDPATELARSNLPGLLKVNIPIFLASAELDPPIMAAFNDTLKDQLCKAGHCPTMAMFKEHSHMSEVFSPNTKDDSVTSPILKWMKKVK